MKTKILIAVDDANLSDVLRSLFRSLEYRVKSCGEEEARGDVLHAEAWDVVVCGLEFGHGLLSDRPSGACGADILVVVDYAELEEGKAIMEAGASGFLVRPIRSEEALRLLEKVLAARYDRLKATGVGGKQSEALEKEEAEASCECKKTDAPELHYGLMIGEHPSMQALYKQMEKVAE
ncbi:MAG: hypothetical protein IKX48_06615, partial [Victivallales bacterium]|nr:hypothetical protein [Victivallales bacterium]